MESASTKAPWLTLLRPGERLVDKTTASAVEAGLSRTEEYQKKWQAFLEEGYADMYWMLHTADGRSIPIYLGSRGDCCLTHEQVMALQAKYGKGNLTAELQLEMLSELTQLCAIDSQLAVNLLPSGSKQLAKAYPDPELLRQYS